MTTPGATSTGPTAGSAPKDVTTINPLSNPKGVRLVCELCGKVAYIQCPFCRVTYYCSKEHQSTDWNGIHMKICQLLIPLRTQNSALGSEEERTRRKATTRESQLNLLELTRQEALKLLHEGQFEIAIPAALQSLKLSLDYYGNGALELVPAYLLLGEASIGLGRYNQAETYLSAAKWAVLKQPECPNRIKSQLHRIFGQLYAAVGNHDLALQQLANDIYHSSLEYGPLSFYTCGGYYQMGNVFLDQSKNSVDCALAMYEKVVEVCVDTLISAIHKYEETGIKVVDEAQQVECFQMLSKILSTRQQILGNVHTATGENFFALGLIHYYMRNMAKARASLEKAVEILVGTLGADHTQSVRARSYLERLCIETPPSEAVDPRTLVLSSEHNPGQQPAT